MHYTKTSQSGWLLLFHSSLIELVSIFYEENFNANYHPASPLQFNQALLSSKELAQTLVC